MNRPRPIDFRTAIAELEASRNRRSEILPDPYDALREAFRIFVDHCDNAGWEIAGRDDEPDILSVELHHPARPGACCIVYVSIAEDLRS
jgi:hypothetical protein